MTAAEFKLVTNDPQLAGIENTGAALDPWHVGERGDFREWCYGCGEPLDRAAYFTLDDDGLAHQGGTARGYCTAECGDQHR